MIPFFDAKGQYNSIKNEIDSAIKNVFEKGRFILNENVKHFEKEFANYCNAKFGIGVASGTEALQIALNAAGIKHGDEVITVPNTSIATASAISLANAKPVFVDIDKDTYTLDSSRLKQVITKKTKAIIPVHLYGNVCDMDPILEVAQKYNLRVIEDCAQAHGTKYKKKKVPIGDIGCFSFYPTKNLGAYGDGGIIVTNDENVSEKSRLIRNYGGKDKDYSLIKGLNSRLDELQAAILRVKLKYLDEWNTKRRKNAKLYSKLLEKTPLIIPIEKPYAKHVYHLYVIRTQKRDRLQKWLSSKGIFSLIHYPVPIHLQKSYSEVKCNLPISEKCAKEILSLPIYPELGENKLKQITKTIKKFRFN